MRLVKISLILIVVALSHVQVQADEYDKYVFRIKAAKSDSESEAIFQTGFVTDKYDGIITALHGVVGRQSITAADESQNQSFTKLKITHADIANDLAVVSSSDLKHRLKHKLAVNQNYNWDALEVHGYPLGIRTQLGSKQVNFLRSGTVSLYDLFPVEMTLKEKVIFKTRKSPRSDTRVLALEAKLESGHSGAPLTNANKEVIGVCIGGIKGTEFSFAIPWVNIKFKEKESIKNELDRLAGLDASQLMMALDLTGKDEPKYPELRISEDVELGYVIVKNVGAPMYNATGRFHGLVYLTASECATDGFISSSPIIFAYTPGHGRQYSQIDGSTSYFDTDFPPEFVKIETWFKRLKQRVGPIRGHCLTSVTVHHLIKVSYEGEAAGSKERYFSARKTLEHYIDKKTHRQVDKKRDTITEVISPDEWKEDTRNTRSFPGIVWPFRVEEKHVSYARKYLLKRTKSSSPAVPSAPGNLKLNTK